MIQKFILHSSKIRFFVLTFLLLFVSTPSLSSQTTDVEGGINKLFFSEVDHLIGLIKKDLEEAVIDGEIPTRLAITGFTTFGLSAIEGAYFEESINQLFLENIAFNFRRVKEAFQLSLKRENGKIKVFRGATEHSDYLKFARSVGAEHYVDIFVYRLENVNSFEIYVHDANNNEVIWNNKWYVRRGGTSFRYMLTWKSQFRNLLEGVDQYKTGNYLSNMFGIRLLGFGEVGALVEPGVIYGYYTLFEQYDITFSFGVGPRMGINLLELADVAVLHFDIWIVLSSLAVVDIPMNIVDPDRQSLLYIPTFLFSPNVGIAFGLKDSNFIIEAGIDPYNVAPYFNLGFNF